MGERGDIDCILSLYNYYIYNIFSSLTSAGRQMTFRKRNALMLAAHRGFKEKVELLVNVGGIDLLWRVRIVRNGLDAA